VPQQREQSRVEPRHRADHEQQAEQPRAAQRAADELGGHRRQPPAERREACVEHGHARRLEHAPGVARRDRRGGRVVQMVPGAQQVACAQDLGGGVAPDDGLADQHPVEDEEAQVSRVASERVVDLPAAARHAQLGGDQMLGRDRELVGVQRGAEVRVLLQDVDDVRGHDLSRVGVTPEHAAP
jgi:hypothetical protein